MSNGYLGRFYSNLQRKKERSCFKSAQESILIRDILNYLQDTAVETFVSAVLATHVMDDEWDIQFPKLPQNIGTFGLLGLKTKVKWVRSNNITPVTQKVARKATFRYWGIRFEVRKSDRADVEERGEEIDDDDVDVAFSGLAVM